MQFKEKSSNMSDEMSDVLTFTKKCGIINKKIRFGMEKVMTNKKPPFTVVCSFLISGALVVLVVLVF